MNNIKQKFYENRHHALGFVAICILTFFSYSNIESHTFLNWDDITYILNNDHIQEFNTANLYWMFTNYEQGNWHPITWLSFTANFELWGQNPVAFKLVNISIHALNSCLVFFLTYLLLYAAKTRFHAETATTFGQLSEFELNIAAFFAALLFAVHPTHVESVTWIVERKDVLSALFFLATLVSYTKYRLNDNHPRWLTLALVFFLCSLMSKPMAVTIPAVLIILDIYPLKAVRMENFRFETVKSLLSNKMSFILLALVVSMITIITQRAGIHALESAPIDTRLINACMSIILYLYNFLIPTDLSPFYPFHPWSLQPNLFSFIPVAGFLAVTGYFLYLFKKKTYFPLAAWLYMIVTLLPVIGIVKVGFQAAADRYTYIPLLSVFVVTGAGVALLLHYAKQFRFGLHATASLCVIVLLLFSHLTYRQNDVWESDIVLWTTVNSKYPGQAAVSYSNLGTHYYGNGDFNKAVQYFGMSLGIEPDNIDTLEKIAKAYEQAQNDALARFYYESIIKVVPETPKGYVLLGDFYYRRQQLEQAKSLYSTAFSIAPQYEVTLLRGALVDYLNGAYQDSEKKLEYALTLSPEYFSALQLSALVATKLGNTSKARTIASKILTLKGDKSLAQELLTTIDNRSL